MWPQLEVLWARGREGVAGGPGDAALLHILLRTGLLCTHVRQGTAVVQLLDNLVIRTRSFTAAGRPHRGDWVGDRGITRAKIQGEVPLLVRHGDGAGQGIVEHVRRTCLLVLKPPDQVVAESTAVGGDEGDQGLTDPAEETLVSLDRQEFVALV